METDKKPKKKWLLGLFAVIASLLMCFTFSSNTHVYAENSKQASSQAASSSESSSGSSSSSGTASEQQADPWTQAVSKLSGEYSTKKGAPWPEALKSTKGSVNLGNIYSYLGPQNPVFAQNSVNGFADNFSSDGNHQENAHGMANMALGYGSALYTVGLDHPLANSTVGKTRVNLGRMLGGTCYLLAYTAVVTINKCFSTLTGWIKYVNVLDWLGNFPTNGPFGDLGETVKGIVNSLQGLGIVFWSFALAVLLLLGAMGFRFAGGNLSGNTHVDAGPMFIFDEILHFAFRLFNFLVLPLLLATAMDEILSDAGSTFQHDTMAATTTPIYSTLVDFKGAVQHSRLDLPSSIKLNVSFNPNAQTTLSQSQVCDFNAYSAGDSAARDAQTTSNNYNDIDSGSGDIDACYHLISEWMHGYEYEPADFVSYAEGHTSDTTLEAGTSPQGNSSNNSDSSSNSSTAKNPTPQTAGEAAAVGAAQTGQTSGGTGSSSNQESLLDDLTGTGSSSGKNKYLYITNGTLTGKWGGTYSTAEPAKDSSCMKAGSSAGGLSTLGMYNFLATNFDDSSATYETNAKDQTTYDGVSHYEVGIAGRGLAAFANWMLSLSQLVCIAIFGVWTFIAVISAVFSGMTKALMYLGANALGALQGTIKLVACCVMLIVEFVGTSFFYIIGIHLLLGASQLLPEIVNSGGQSSSMIVQASSNVNFTTGANLLTSIALFWLTFQMIRLRGVIMKSFNEMAESAVRSVLGSPDRHFNHSANLATNEAANGHTYNRNGENDLRKVERDSNSGSGVPGGNGANGRNGRDGHGSIVGRGQFQQSPKNANPTGFGRFTNYKQGQKDAIHAKEQELNRHLTDAEKKQVKREYARQQAGNAAYRVAGKAADAIGSHSLARALMGHAANRDAKQQVQRMEKAMNGQKLRENGAYAKDVNELDTFTNGKRKNGEIDNDAQETKNVQARQNAMENVQDAMRGMSEQVGADLAQQKAEDGTIANNQEMLDATEKAMGNSMSDQFNDIAQNGGSLQQLSDDVHDKKEALNDALKEQKQLTADRNAALGSKDAQVKAQANTPEAEAAYKAKLAQSNEKVNQKRAELKKAQTAARVAAGAAPVSASMMKKPTLKSKAKQGLAESQQKGADMRRNIANNAATKNGKHSTSYVRNKQNADRFQASANKLRNSTTPPTVNQANNALRNIAKARADLNHFVQSTNGKDNKSSGVTFAAYTPEQQQTLNKKVAAVKAAEQHADAIGLAPETYDSTEHLIQNTRTLNQQLNAAASGKTIKRGMNTHFEAHELSQNIADQIANDHSTLVNGAPTSYDTFKDSANSLNQNIKDAANSLKRK